MIEEESDLAKSEFFYRYSSFLLKVCRRACSNFDSGPDLANDIFQNSMLKGIQNIQSVHKNVTEETSNLNLQIKKWLSTIANNEFNEFLRKNNDEKFLAKEDRISSTELEIEFDLNNIIEDPIENSQFGHLNPEHILKILSDRERTILMGYFNYYDPNDPDKHLPDKEIRRLCDMFEITSQNLRTIKSRALKKLRAHNSQLIEQFS